MKLLWITEFFPDNKLEDVTGGVEARYLYLSKFINQPGLTIKVIHRASSGNTTTLTFKDFLRRIVFFFEALKKGFLSDFDIVEGGNLTTYFCAWIIGFVKHKPVVFCIHDIFGRSWLDNFGLLGILGIIAEKISLALPGVKYLSVSHTVKEKLVASGINENQITISYNGTVIQKINPLPKKIYELIAVNRLVSYKNVSHIITAVGSLKTTYNKKIRLLVVGYGPEANSLKKQVIEMGLSDNVTFTGFVKSHQDVLQLLASSKIFCSASTVEGFGITLIEAAGLGVPFVAYGIAVTNEITNKGQGGLLSKPGDVHELKNQIAKLLKNNALYEKKSQEALAMAKKYDWKTIAKNLGEFYKKVLLGND